MPIYEYQCTTCGHQLETIQKISDDPLKDCPACGKPTFNKMISATSFQLKGTGWYATDFRDKGKAVKNDQKPETSANDTKASDTKANPAKNDKSPSSSDSSSKTAG